MTPARHHGFSLLEVALALFVLGFLFTLLPLMLTNLGSMQAADPAASATESGEQALVGFIIQQNRLPCPDTNADGGEDCNGAHSGQVPYRTLGLGRPLVNAAGFPLRYGVYQQATVSLTSLANHYQPALLAGSAANSGNALDFCQGLRLGLGAGLQASEMSVRSLDGQSRINPAFLLIDPGLLDADNDGSPLDGSNGAGLIVESAGQAKSSRYDDQVRAVGFAELAARLKCPSLVAGVSAMTRDANAAYDMERSYAFYTDFRRLNRDVRRANLSVAKTKREMAIVNTAITAGMVATDVAATVADPSSAAAVAAFAINSALAVAMTADELKSTAEELDDKTDELATAETQLSAAQSAERDAEAYLNARVAEVMAQEQKGWFQ